MLFYSILLKSKLKPLNFLRNSKPRQTQLKDKLQRNEITEKVKSNFRKFRETQTSSKPKINFRESQTSEKLKLLKFQRNSNFRRFRETQTSEISEEVKLLKFQRTQTPQRNTNLWKFRQTPNSEFLDIACWTNLNTKNFT